MRNKLARGVRSIQDVTDYLIKDSLVAFTGAALDVFANAPPSRQQNSFYVGIGRQPEESPSHAVYDYGRILHLGT